MTWHKPAAPMASWGLTPSLRRRILSFTMPHATVRGAGCASWQRGVLSRWADVFRYCGASKPAIGNGFGVRIPGVEGSAAQALPALIFAAAPGWEAA